MKMKKMKYNMGGKVMKYRGGGMPDLTGDGKVTRADVLKGRGVKLNMGGKVPTYAGMPMMAEGGMVKKKKKKVSKKKSIDGVARRGRTKGRMV